MAKNLPNISICRRSRNFNYICEKCCAILSSEKGARVSSRRKKARRNRDRGPWVHISEFNCRRYIDTARLFVARPIVGKKSRYRSCASAAQIENRTGPRNYIDCDFRQKNLNLEIYSPPLVRPSSRHRAFPLIAKQRVRKSESSRECNLSLDDPSRHM